MNRRDYAEQPDTGKIVLGVALVAGALYAFKKIALDHPAAAAAPPQPQIPGTTPPLPQPQPGGASPYPSPGAIPQPSNSGPAPLPNLNSGPTLPAAAPSWWPSWLPTPPGLGTTPVIPPAVPGNVPNLPSSPMGDKAQVGDDVLVSATALAPLPFSTTVVQMHITDAQPNSPVVVAVFNDPQTQGTALQNAPVTIPRSAIIGIVKSGPMPQQPAPQPASPVPSLPIPIPGSGVPGLPNVPVPTPGGAPVPVPVVYLGDPLQLVQGMRYRARLDLGTMENLVANEQMIGNQFNALGFQNVKVWHQAFQLPSDFPADVKEDATARTWWVEGLYTNPNQTVAKPPQASKVWIASVG